MRRGVVGPGDGAISIRPCFFLADPFFLDAAGRRERYRRGSHRSSVAEPCQVVGRRGVISQEARRPVYQTLPFRGSNVDVRVASSAPPGISRRQRNGTGCPVGNRRRCWILRGTRLANSLDVSCLVLDGDPEAPTRPSRDFPEPPSLFVDVDGQRQARER